MASYSPTSPNDGSCAEQPVETATKKMRSGDGESPGSMCGSQRSQRAPISYQWAKNAFQQSHAQLQDMASIGELDWADVFPILYGYTATENEKARKTFAKHAKDAEVSKPALKIQHAQAGYAQKVTITIADLESVYGSPAVRCGFSNPGTTCHIASALHVVAAGVDTRAAVASSRPVKHSDVRETLQKICAKAATKVVPKTDMALLQQRLVELGSIGAGQQDACTTLEALLAELQFQLPFVWEYEPMLDAEFVAMPEKNPGHFAKKSNAEMQSIRLPVIPGKTMQELLEVATGPDEAADFTMLVDGEVRKYKSGRRMLRLEGSFLSSDIVSCRFE